MSARVLPPRSAVRSPTARATVLVLWQAAPWVLLVLVVMSALGGAFAAWSTWSNGQPGGAVIVQGDSGVAGGVSFFVGLTMLFSCARAVRTAVPVLVAGGITRRAVAGGALAAGVALAVVTTGLLTLVALVGEAVQRAIAARPAVAVVPSSGSDAYTSSLTISYDAPGVFFNPVETLPWFVMAALGGVLIGAAWYRWRARGVVGVVVVLGAMWAVYVAVALGYLVGEPAAAGLDGAAAPLVPVLPCVVLVVGAWLVLRRAPLRQAAR